MTDATLTLQIISGLVSLTGVVVNTFSSRSEDSTGGLSSSLPAATAPSHREIVCKVHERADKKL